MTPDRPGLAVGFILAATFTMALQDAVVKLVSADLPLWQLFTLRSAMVLPVLVVVAVGSRNGRSLWPEDFGWAFLRGLFLVGMYVAFYAALPHLPISTVAAAYYTGPLFITLFAGLLLRERIGLFRAGCIALGFVGVLVILRPGGAAFAPVLLVPILSAVLYALAAILTRSRCAAETPVALSLALNLGFLCVGLAASAVLMAVAPDPETVARNRFLLGPWVALDGRAWSVLGFLALANLVIHLCLARAYQAAAPQVVASFDYAYLGFAALWGFLLLREVPDWPTLIGMAVIATGGLAMLLASKPARSVAGGYAAPESRPGA